MKLFECDHCGRSVYFDNDTCVTCGHRLGFAPGDVAMYALKQAEGDVWYKADDESRRFRLCENTRFGVCNWVIDEGEDETFCSSCRHNNLIPDTSTEVGLDRFRHICAAERHLFYSLLRWNVRAPTRRQDPQAALVFDFLEDTVAADGTVTPAMTGHDDGVISLRAAEADHVTREIIRDRMNEPYRTMLGHFRHEVGHYIWDRLVRDGNRLEGYRAVFGDEREDYQQALKRHYENGPRPDWPQHHVSAYASTHPWEDFAESFAHSLHIVDTLETARSFGLAIEDAALEPLGDPYKCADGERLAEAWIPLTISMNAIHRSMGQRDFYPFVLTPEIVSKIDYIIRLMNGRLSI